MKSGDGYQCGNCGGCECRCGCGYGCCWHYMKKMQRVSNVYVAVSVYLTDVC